MAVFDPKQVVVLLDGREISGWAVLSTILSISPLMTMWLLQPRAIQRLI